MKISRLRKQAIIIMAGWTMFICVLAIYWALDHWQIVKTLALNEARVSYDKDILYRRWAAMHGGVYVPVTEKTPPNPYLSHVPERDISTPSGKRLTLINPAYMTRQVHELARQSEGVLGHITSLNPIRAENAPDPWETKALEAFQAGAAEVNSVEDINGRRYLRFMRPMITEESCLKCHAWQGYKKGDIRGGIGVSVPMDVYLHVFYREMTTEGFVFGVIWLLGIGLIFGASKKIEGQTRELLSSEERYRLLVELSPDMVAIHKDGVFTFINRGGALLLGAADEKQIVGRPVMDFVHSSYHDVVKNRIETIIHQNAKAPLIEEKFIRIDGTMVDVDVAALPFEYQGEKAVFVLARNISERKRAEEVIRLSEEKYRTLFETMREGFALHEIILDGSGRPCDYRFLDLNPAFEALTGLTKSAILGRTVLEVMPATEHYWIEIYGSVALTGEAQVFENYSGVLGKSFEVTAFSPLKGQFAVIFSDITGRKKLEEQLMQSQKMEAIGILAGGVAHDFNNILSAIMGHAGILQMKMTAQDPLLENVQEILNSSDKAAALVRGLLAFSRKQVINPRPVNVNDAIRRVEKLLLRLIGEDIELRTRYADADLIVLIDIGQLEQVLMNLATNARDAMPRGGTLVIETARVSMNEAFITGHGYGRKGDYALVTVSDTGAGMDEKTRERIFEPFFTTKEVGRGTGLGLSMVYGVVRQNNSFIDCFSEPGKGTSFMIYLPLTEGVAEDPEMKKTEIMARGTETILAAEDDEALRKLYQTVLQEFGYTVIAVSDGEEAVARIRECSDHVDLLILDMVMPKKNGMEAYEEIRRLRPGIKVLFVSGYTADMLKEKGGGGEDLPLIAKPVSPADLVNKVRELLNIGEAT